MTYLVTGATGWIGHHLVPELLKRSDDVYVLVGPGADEAHRFDRCSREWVGGDRVRPVRGDPRAAGLGIEPDWIAAHRGSIDHVFHLAAGPGAEMRSGTAAVPRSGTAAGARSGTAAGARSGTAAGARSGTAAGARSGTAAGARSGTAAGARSGTAAGAGSGAAAGMPSGTRAVLDVAERLEAGVLHHVSTVEMAGAAEGLFTEDMFDVGQRLPTSYQRAAFEAERVVREQARVPWRIYRPSIVIGHSRTGEIDRLSGPYYFFRLLRMAAQLPRILPLLVPKLGETNMVPVDFVARALDHLAHVPAPSGSTFHVVDPRRQSAVDVLNLFADQAGAPHLVEVMPKQTLDMVRRLPGLGWALPKFGVPQDVLEHTEFGCWFESRNAAAALAATDIRVPPLAAYAPVIWKYWTENWV